MCKIVAIVANKLHITRLAGCELQAPQLARSAQDPAALLLHYRRAVQAHAPAQVRGTRG